MNRYVLNYDNFSRSKKCASHFHRKPQMEINSLEKQKHGYLIHAVRCESLHEGSFEITLTVPLKSDYN